MTVLSREEVERLPVGQVLPVFDSEDSYYREAPHEPWDSLRETALSLFDRVAELEQEAARMREVLEPFAAEAEGR